MSIPACDRKLPGLLRALDDDAISVLLSAALRGEGSAADFMRARGALVKYVPGKRAVVVYDLSAPGTAWHGSKIFGKLYRKERGLAIFNTLQALWQTTLVQRSFFLMPEPLAYVAELGMVLQRASRGRALTAVRHPDELFTAMQRAAKNLAALHDLPCPAGEVKTLQDHLVKYCHPGPEILMEALPMLAPMVRDLMDGIWADLDLQTVEPCPVHGDLNLAQVFIAHDRAIFIDFDGFCRSHAALDVGNFLITLAEHFGEDSGELRHGFLEAYLSAQAAHKLHGLRAYQAFAYLRRAMICFRLQDRAAREQRVRKMLLEGLACLRANDQ